MSRSHALISITSSTTAPTSDTVNPTHLMDEQGIYQISVTVGQASVSLQGRMSGNHLWTELANSGTVTATASKAATVSLLPQMRAVLTNGTTTTCVVSLME